MTQTPIEQSGNLRIGTVDFVSPNEIKVAIEIDAPDSVVLDSGTPRPFPRVNGYLLVSADEEILVGQVEWITIERSPFPKRRGMQDFGLVDLPYPLRRLRLNPLGMLNEETEGEYTFKRGAAFLPTVGASVSLPTATQLRSIVESGERRTWSKSARVPTREMQMCTSIRIDCLVVTWQYLEIPEVANHVP